MQALSLLIKPASGNCNMRCRYCFYADVTHARAVENRGIMSLETLEIIVRRALEEATQMVSFGFQGGEPTLAGLDFFRALIELQKKHNPKRLQIYNAIQTNGLNINKEWALFLADNHFLTGLSIDGSKDVHDALRPDPQEKGTFTRGLKAAALMTKAGAEFNILSVITKPFALHPDKAYQFYKKHGLRYVQLIPCLDGLDEAPGTNPYSLTGAIFGKFLCRFFDLWYDDYTRGEYVSVRTFDNYIRMLLGEPPENCGMMGYCQGYPVIEADGTVYPCDFYVLDQYKLGDVRHDSFTDLMAGDACRAFTDPSRLIPPGCTGCEFAPLCRGGCRRDREPFMAGQPSANRLCEGYKMFFAHALPRMQAVARQLRQRG